MAVKPELLKDVIFADQPVNWLIHAEGFYCAGLKLVEVLEKLTPRPKLISLKETFEQRYTYKIAIYLLSHAIELLLKSIVSWYNKEYPNKLLKSPEKFGHNVCHMVEELTKAGVILNVTVEDAELFKLTDEYLKWFGRYYSPSSIDNVVAKSYIEPNEEGMIEFKYKIQYPETHSKIIKLYQFLMPKVGEAELQMHYLLHTPA